MISKNKSGVNEIIFIVGFFLPNIIRPLLHLFSSASSFILLGLYIFLFVIALFNNGFCIMFSKNKKTIIFAIIILLVFLVDFVTRKNSELFGYFVALVRCFILPLCLYCTIKERRNLLLYWSIFGVIIGCLYCVDPLLEYRLSNGYMPFGFNIMLPAFCGALILCTYYKKRSVIFLAVLFFFEIAIFANKGSLISASILFIFIYVFGKKRKTSLFRLIMVVLLIAAIWNVRSDILHFFISVADKLSFDSYSINTLKTMLDGNAKLIFDARTDIWDITLKEINGSFFVGYGIGWFRSMYDVYPHNFILELMVSDGLFAAIPFILYTMYCLFRILRCKQKEDYIFGMCLFIIWIIPLSISLTLWDYAPIWLFFIFSGEIVENKIFMTD